jgi:septum formation protein
MLILASTSVVRAEMLKEAGVSFTVVPSPYDEEQAKDQLEGLSHADLALALANGKAEAVSVMHPNSYVIGADQLCTDGTHIYSKPVTVERAFTHLRLLAGKEHFQHSAACLYHHGKKIWQTCEIVTLTMRPLTDTEIYAYIAEDSPLNACGAYCYEKQGYRLFSHVNGSSAAIKGLPLESLMVALHTRCATVLS